MKKFENFKGNKKKMSNIKNIENISRTHLKVLVSAKKSEHIASISKIKKNFSVL